MNGANCDDVKEKYLDTPVSQSTNTNIKGNLGSSSQNAVPLGTTVRTVIERGDPYLTPQLYNLDITILETLRGIKASEKIRNEGIIEKGTEDRFDFLLVHIKLNYSRKVRGLGDEVFKLREGQFAAVAADNKTEYKLPVVSKQPQPSLIGEIFSTGDSRDGWVLLQVPVEDDNPRLIFKRNHVEGMYGIWGNIWFKLK
jgi:hypothetical protein